MAVFEIVTVMVVFTFIIFLRSLPRIGVFVSYIAIGIFFLFGMSNIENAFQLTAFYSALLFLVGLLQLFPFTRIESAPKKVSIFVNMIVASIIGAIIAFILLASSNQINGLIIGVPKLAVIEPSTFNLIAIGLLAFIEGAALIHIYLLIKNVIGPMGLRMIPIIGRFMNPIIISIIAYLSSVLTLVIFHDRTYGGSISNLSYAFIAFGLFLGSYIIFDRIIGNGDIPQNVGHFWHNVFIATKQTLEIAR